MEKLEVNVNGDQKELVIRTGAAPKVHQPRGFKVETTINGVLDFYAKRPCQPEDSHVLVDINKARVVLVTKDGLAEEETRISGTMVPNQDYLDLGINANKLYEHHDLERVLRNRPHLFATR